MAQMPKPLIRQGRLPRLLRKSEKERSQIQQFERTYQKLIRKLTRMQRETGGFMTQLSQRHEDLPSYKNNYIPEKTNFSDP